MRRFIAILLMLLLAANISGAKLTHHICGKVFQYASLHGHKKNTKCCCKGSGVDKGCCKTTYFKVNLEDKKTISQAYTFDKPPVFESLAPLGPITVPESIGNLLTPAKDRKFIPQKVRWRQDDLCIFHCVYRI